MGKATRDWMRNRALREMERQRGSRESLGVSFKSKKRSLDMHVRDAETGTISHYKFCGEFVGNVDRWFWQLTYTYGDKAYDNIPEPAIPEGRRLRLYRWRGWFCCKQGANSPFFPLVHVTVFRNISVPNPVWDQFLLAKVIDSL